MCGMRCRCGDVLCATHDVCWRLEVVLYALEMREGLRRVLLCMLEAVEGELCLLEVTEVMRGVLLYAGGCGRWVLFAGGAWRCRR